jgi:N-acetylmuramoyl-L-alanine amidase
MWFSLPGRAWFVASAVLCVSAAATTPPTRLARHAIPASPWEQAQKQRAALEAVPTGGRTRAAYTRVLEAYRAIYHDNPRDTHAPEAILVVGQLLEEQGRDLDDEKSLHAAVGQYEFLRSQYPTSPLRAGALLAEARLERDDLNAAVVASAKYAELVKESPRSEAGRAAKVELAELKGQGSGSRGPGSVETAASGVAARTVPEGLKPPSAAGVGGTAEAVPISKAGSLTRPAVAATVEAGSSAALRNDNKTPLGVESKHVQRVESKPAVASERVTATSGEKPTALAIVSGIRQWSTPTYTRVAIDLGDEVKFEAARVPHPDRIYFDLHGAKLAQELVGKSFNVTDNGFLKRIRAAQASGDVTRVVLDVSDVTEYSAFLLPNPYRLIIDIHGKQDQATTQRDELVTAEAAPEGMTPEVPALAARTASAAANVSGLPAMAVTDGGDAVRPVKPLPGAPVAAAKASAAARPVPNTVAVAKPATSSEVAAVSLAPDKVEATHAPTSKPISATVPAAAKEMAAPSSKKTKAAAVALNATPAKAAEKTADGETSLIRALGLKINRIVIDAGHGGHDSGTLGDGGIQEKDVVLDVALRVGKLLHDRLGAEIIYTRSDDTFIPLETRTAIANKAQADLFLSIHANSSQDATARGVETYYLNFTSDATALDVAARENAVSGQSIHQLSDLVKKITLKDKIAESREFAADVEGSLYAGLTKGNAGLRDRGVKKAPFVVLIGANMPSILAEISFVTNPRDAEQLREPEYRERVAESLFAGVAKYENGLAGARPAQAPAVKRASIQ